MIEQVTKEVYRLNFTSHTLPPYKSTNSYLLISNRKALIIDPGFYETKSLDIVNNILKEHKAKLESVLLTHTHRDHVEGIGLLLEPNPKLPIYLHYREAHRLDKQLNLVKTKNKQDIIVGSILLKAIFTAGHSRGHLSYYFKNERIAFVGDLLAKNSSTWVGTPEGNVNDYLNSLKKLKVLELTKLAPGHGKIITKPYDKIESAKQHRLDRLEQILASLKTGDKSFSTLRDVVYPNLSERLIPFAERSLQALIIKLKNDSKIESKNQKYHLVSGS